MALAQIIFFSAVALFFVLVLRRFSWAVNLGNTLTNLGRTVLAGLLAVGAWVLVKFKRGGVRNARTFSFNKTKKDPGIFVDAESKLKPNAEGSSFWVDEPMESKPELIMSHTEEGEQLIKAGDLEGAEKFFLIAATKNPQDARVYAKLGLIYLQTKSYQDAIDALKVAVKLDKHNPSRHYNLALAYWGNKDSQRAIASLREAIGLDPVSAKYRQFLEELLNSE